MNRVLEGYELLRELGDRERRALQLFLEPRTLEAGEVLFRRGEESRELFLVAEGRLRVEAGGERLGTIGPGEALGACGLMTIGNRECDAVAEVDSTVLVLSRESYLRLHADEPMLVLILQDSILRSLAGAVRGAVEERPGDA